MSDQTGLSRRRFVSAVAAAGVAGVAGCGGGSGEDEGTTTTADPTTTTSDGGSGGGEWTETDTVDMTDDLTFEPRRIQVSAGTTVTWENVGAIGHTVTAYEDEIPDGATYFASGDFDSQDAAASGYPDEGNIPGGESYEHTFETTGEYKYYCIPHETADMVGYVKVV